MKRFVLAAIVSVLVCGLVRETGATEHLSPVETLVFNNFHQEMVNCFAYYQIANKAGMIRGEKDVAASYQKTSDVLLNRIFVFGKILGINDEAAQTRMKLAAEDHARGIDSDFTNLSILNEKYAYICKIVAESPESRILFWMYKAAPGIPTTCWGY